MNVGASSVTDAGDYFAWGEVVTKTEYSWNTYFDSSDEGSTFTKYDTPNMILEYSDDAARSNMGGCWRMPTIEEWKELCKNTDTPWTDEYNGTGVSGVICTSKTDATKSIFLPVTGHYNGTSKPSVMDSSPLL